MKNLVKATSYNRYKRNPITTSAIVEQFTPSIQPSNRCIIHIVNSVSMVLQANSNGILGIHLCVIWYNWLPILSIINDRGCKTTTIAVNKRLVPMLSNEIEKPMPSKYHRSVNANVTTIYSVNSICMIGFKVPFFSFLLFSKRYIPPLFIVSFTLCPLQIKYKALPLVPNPTFFCLFIYI